MGQLSSARLPFLKFIGVLKDIDHADIRKNAIFKTEGKKESQVKKVNNALRELS
jgi:hypothetical protein